MTLEETFKMAVSIRNWNLPEYYYACILLKIAATVQ